jgi:hypothetical protein
MASWDTRSWAAACATVRRSSAKSYTRPVRFSLFLVSHLPNLASRRAAPSYVLRGTVALKTRSSSTACLFSERDCAKSDSSNAPSANLAGIRSTEWAKGAFRWPAGLRCGCVRGFPDSFRNEGLGSSPRKPQEMGHRAYMRGPSGALSCSCLYQARGGGGPHTLTPALYIPNVLQETA